MIRFGSSRIVFLIGKWAVKIPINKCGIEQSQQEIKTWNKYKSKPFNKIISKIGFITIHQKAKAVDLTNFKLFRDRIVEYEKNYPELKFKRGDIYRHENWGIVNNEFVIIDYGLNIDIENKYY